MERLASHLSVTVQSIIIKIECNYLHYLIIRMVLFRFGICSLSSSWTTASKDLLIELIRERN